MKLLQTHQCCTIQTIICVSIFLSWLPAMDAAAFSSSGVADGIKHRDKTLFPSRLRTKAKNRVTNTITHGSNTKSTSVAAHVESGVAGRAKSFQKQVKTPHLQTLQPASANTINKAPAASKTKKLSLFPLRSAVKKSQHEQTFVAGQGKKAGKTRLLLRQKLATETQQNQQLKQEAKKLKRELKQSTEKLASLKRLVGVKRHSVIVPNNRNAQQAARETLGKLASAAKASKAKEASLLQRGTAHHTKGQQEPAATAIEEVEQETPLIWGIPKVVWVILADVCAMVLFLGCSVFAAWADRIAKENGLQQKSTQFGLEHSGFQHHYPLWADRDPIWRQERDLFRPPELTPTLGPQQLAPAFAQIREHQNGQTV